MKIQGPIRIEKIANGHLMLTIRNRGLFNILYLRFILQVRHGFCRKGDHIILPDEGIGPDYICGKICLHTGYEHFSGLYIMSDDDAGDKFINLLKDELS
jgi:hypothetical protein